MTEISPESHGKINGKMNNLLKNFKLLHEKQKNGDENILKLETMWLFQKRKLILSSKKTLNFSKNFGINIGRSKERKII